MFAAGAEDEPVRPDAPYWIASVTKAFIATVVLQSVEEGAIGLDEPLVAYLGSARLRGLHVLGAMRIRLPRALSPLKPFPTLVGHTGVSGSWAFFEPATGRATVGTVDRFAEAALPFRFAPSVAGTAAG